MIFSTKNISEDYIPEEKLIQETRENVILKIQITQQKMVKGYENMTHKRIYNGSRNV